MRFHRGVALYHLAGRDGLLLPVEERPVQEVPLGGYFAESPWTFRSAEVGAVRRLFNVLANHTDDRIGLLEACVRHVEEHGDACPDPSEALREIDRIVDRITEWPLPRSGSRTILGIGASTNVGHPRDLWNGRTFTEDMDEALRHLDGLRIDGHTRLTIGGPDLVARARARGPAEVEVLTNGRMLAYPWFLARLAAAGADLVTVLLHHPVADGHDAAVRVPGAFEQMTGGIRAYARLGRRAAVMAVAGPENRGRLVEMAHLASALGAREFRVAVPLGSLDLGCLGATLDEITAAAREASSLGLAAGFDREMSLGWSRR
jgi:hypothetical protein